MDKEQEKRYVFVMDEDCHWYLLPYENLEEWNRWEEFACENPDDPKAWNVPEAAKRIDGCHRYTFTNPVDMYDLERTKEDQRK